ncbi:hypothetical protein K438DRAFT_1948086 [Mycena galopus ATCC 62051]|nr:hypothetical protein K438DRAFT_1948086 [Mycena galopus ATCC 62051]
MCAHFSNRNIKFLSTQINYVGILMSCFKEREGAYRTRSWPFCTRRNSNLRYCNWFGQKLPSGVEVYSENLPASFRIFESLLFNLAPFLTHPLQDVDDDFLAFFWNLGSVWDSKYATLAAGWGIRASDALMVMESSSVVFLSTKAPSNATSPTHALCLPPATGMTTNALQAPRTVRDVPFFGCTLLRRRSRVTIFGSAWRRTVAVPKFRPPLLFADGIQRARRKQHGRDSARRTIGATPRDLSPSAATRVFNSTPPAGLVDGARGAETTCAYRWHPHSPSGHPFRLPQNHHAPMRARARASPGKSQGPAHGNSASYFLTCAVHKLPYSHIFGLNFGPYFLVTVAELQLEEVH